MTRLSSLIWALLLAALAMGARPCNAGSEPPTLYIHVFLSKDCPHCEPIQKAAVEKLSQKLGCRILPTYHDMDDMIEYKRLVLLERRYKKPGNDLPVVVAGEMMLGGKGEIERQFETLMREAATRGGCPDIELPSLSDVAAAFARTDAAKEIHIAYFDEPGCRACQRVERMLTQFEREFKTLRVHRFSRAQRAPKILLEALGESARLPADRRLIVPAVFIGQEALVKEDLTDDPLRDLIAHYAQTGASAWWETLPEADLQAARERLTERFRAVGIGSVLAGGLIDGINPCAFATLAFLVGYLTTLKRKGRDILFVGGLFSVGVFVSYMAIGLGLSEALLRLEFLPAVSAGLSWLIIAVTFALAALSLRDAIKARQGRMNEIQLKVPGPLRRYMNLLITRQMRTRHVALAALFLGVALSGLEFVCTGQIYLPLLQFMNSISVDRARSTFLLLLYNLAFILPLVGVFLAAYFGVGSERLTDFTRKHLAAAKLLMAIFFAALGAALLFFR